jgi:hypothetical protein
VFIARGGRSEATTTIFTEQEVRDLVERMLKVRPDRLRFHALAGQPAAGVGAGDEGVTGRALCGVAGPEESVPHSC